MSVFAAFGLLLCFCFGCFILGVAYKVHVDEQRARRKDFDRFIRGDGP